MKYSYLAIMAMILFSACEKEIMFDTIEAPAPTVTSENWSATAIDSTGVEIITVGFSEGGRLFRLPPPLDDSTSTPYRDINFKTLLNSGDDRAIDSITVELSWIPSFPSNAPQPWTVYDGILVGSSSSEYQFDYTLNLDDWMDDYVCFNYITGTPGGCGFTDWEGVGGAFGLPMAREDNMLRLTLHFDNGTAERIAQVQFGLPISEAGLK